MIDVTTEELVRMTAKAVTTRIRGLDVSSRTLDRWRLHGLEIVKFGGRVYTSAEALQRYAERGTEPDRPALPSRTPARRRREMAAAAAKLDAVGIIGDPPKALPAATAQPATVAGSTADLSLSVVYPEAGRAIRVVGTALEPWTVAADVCKAIGHTQPARAVEGLDDDEKGVRQIHTLGGVQKLLCVSEAGLYTLLIRSDKPAAKPFRRWLTHDVLPCIRAHGCYPAPK